MGARWRVAILLAGPMIEEAGCENVFMLAASLHLIYAVRVQAVRIFFVLLFREPAICVMLSPRGEQNLAKEVPCLS